MNDASAQLLTEIAESERRDVATRVDEPLKVIEFADFKFKYGLTNNKQDITFHFEDKKRGTVAKLKDEFQEIFREYTSRLPEMGYTMFGATKQQPNTLLEVIALGFASNPATVEMLTVKLPEGMKKKFGG